MVQLFNSIVGLRAAQSLPAAVLTLLAKFRGVGSEGSSPILAVIVDAALWIVGLRQLARLCLEEVEIKHQYTLVTLLHTCRLGLDVGRFPLSASLLIVLVIGFHLLQG